MVVNVEMIHFVQYGILAVLLYPLLLNYESTLLIATLMGAADEAYQYWVLAPFNTEYYDFNDIIINLLGATLGLILLSASGVREKQYRTWLPSLSAILSIILGVIAAILYYEGYLTVYPLEDGGEALITLVRKAQTEFWTVMPPDERFHAVRPLAGFISIFLLLQFYRKLGYTPNPA